MIIKNADVYNNGRFEQKDLFIENELFSESSGGGETIDATGLMAIPSVIDIHTHGAVGFDYSTCDSEGLKAISEYLAKNGVCANCPTNVALPLDKLEEVVKKITEYKTENGFDFVGMHIEGPFLSYEKRGAHNADYLVEPTVSDIQRLVKASNDRIKIISFAPELSGAFEVIEAFKDSITLSVAHTSANYDTAKAAFDAGMKHLTHTFNAMPPLLHRDPSVIGAAFDSPHVFAEVIADNVHVHRSAMRVLFKLFGEQRMVLVSDCLSAAGLPDGEYLSGDLKVIVKDKKATLENGTIAGSSTTLYECLKIAVKDMDIPLVSAIRATSENPAKAIKIFDRYGSIEAGKYANVILVDNDLEIKKVILKGRVVAI